MQHDPLVCIEDAVEACRLILQFTDNMVRLDYCSDKKTKAAVERQFEIIGEALNRLKKIDITMLADIDNWREIIGFRNVLAHGYDVIEDDIVWDSIQNHIPHLLEQLSSVIKNNP